MGIFFLGLVCRKSLLILFTVATLLFFLSWFFLLGSTGDTHLIENISTNPEEFVDSTSPQELESYTTCDPRSAILKVFMYDLPPEFHFGLLDWKPEDNSNSVWPDITKNVPSYPGGLNLQHSIEYWLTLDLLSSGLTDRPEPCSAYRVLDSKEADVVFVPFFSSLSYNRHNKVKPPEKVSRNKLLQDKLVNYLMAQEEWKRSGGRDHIILAHHPNSMMDARTKLFPGIFVLSDFGRYPSHVANVEKDIIAPYKHMIRTFVNDTSGFDDRPTLLYFQGAIYRKDVVLYIRSLDSMNLTVSLRSSDGLHNLASSTIVANPSMVSEWTKFELQLKSEESNINSMLQLTTTTKGVFWFDQISVMPLDTYKGGFIRQELYYLLKDEKDVHFSFGSIRQNGVSEATQGMHSSKFCLNIAGDTPSSNRLFDAIASHCVPVIISDELELPYEDVMDYSEFCVFVRTADALKKGHLIKLIRGIGGEQWTKMWKRLKEIEGYFEYQYPSQKDDAVQMIWQAVARKVPLFRLKLHRWKRFDHRV